MTFRQVDTSYMNLTDWSDHTDGFTRSPWSLWSCPYSSSVAQALGTHLSRCQHTSVKIPWATTFVIHYWHGVWDWKLMLCNLHPQGCLKGVMRLMLSLLCTFWKCGAGSPAQSNVSAKTRSSTGPLWGGVWINPSKIISIRPLHYNSADFSLNQWTPHDELYECVMQKPYKTHIRSLCLNVRHSAKTHTAQYMQLPWILFCKVLKINSSLGTLNQRVVQMSQWCPSVASAMFSFLFSLLDSFKSQESFMLCAHVKARLIVCNGIYTFFSPWQTYSVFILFR